MLLLEDALSGILAHSMEGAKGLRRMVRGKKVSSQELGQHGEALAAQAIRAHGYEIVERNWRCAAGEIDIVARDGSVWVFVEVKTRGGEGYGDPEEAVTVRKKARLIEAGLAYLACHGLDNVPCRIDVVALNMAPGGKVKSLAIYRDAVRADG